MDYIETLDISYAELCATSRCNLRCTHCYQHNDKGRFELSLDLIVEFISFLLKHGCKHLTLSGGEFFVHPDAKRILDIVIATTPLSVTIVTNGTRIRIDELRELPSERIDFIFSVDGFATDHDRRRGLGCFDQTITAASSLSTYGFPVRANVTVDGINSRYLAQLLTYLDEKFDGINLIPIAVTGAALCNQQELKLDDLRLGEVYRLLFRTLTPPRMSNRCTVFPNSISLAYDGTLFPCSMARDMGLLPIGNVRNSTIENVIKEFCSSKAGQGLLSYNSDEVLEDCIQCAAYKICNRGCRIRSLKWHGRIDAPDPFACKIFMNRYPEYGYGGVYWGQAIEVQK